MRIVIAHIYANLDHLKMCNDNSNSGTAEKRANETLNVKIIGFTNEISQEISLNCSFSACLDFIFKLCALLVQILVYVRVCAQAFRHQLSREPSHFAFTQKKITIIDGDSPQQQCTGSRSMSNDECSFSTNSTNKKTKDSNNADSCLQFSHSTKKCNYMTGLAQFITVVHFDLFFKNTISVFELCYISRFSAVR